MSWTEDVLHGLGALLAASNVAYYRASGTYTAGESPVVAFVTPLDSPDQCVTLSLYSTGIPYLAGVQARVRGAAVTPLSAHNLAERVIDACHGREGTLPKTMPSPLMYYTSQADLGLDPQGRREITVNFHLATSRPGVSLVDVVNT